MCAAPATTSTCFTTFRLNESTFSIREEDIYGEHPLIYAKIFQDPPLLLLSDTGCGGHGLSPDIEITSLREYLETYPISSNSSLPLNPHGKLPYLIICTHCHYDHILGIPHFTTPGSNTTFLASSYDPSFITKSLPTHSLCHHLGIETPSYNVSYWADHFEKITYDSLSLNIQILHTPGHTPDELAWYDRTERHLYVGDTLYEVGPGPEPAPIMFPKEGDLIDYMQSLRTLKSFIAAQNEEYPSRPRVKIGCAHITSSVDAAEIVDEVQALFVYIIEGKVPIADSMKQRGEICDFYMEAKDAKFCVRVPRRLVDDARRFYHKHPALLSF
ncbi:Metallo-hydrolase/oxidoreductase [Microthyrium microscopicum]|uniref:Metallo-hydrolase/oxidoreductase n=1 Tax=Microthyrium microscopicum TaxID=703497 RepID=A0A6A6U1E8_9PEZI|nr:Metallo-hydrolase/oxidoreductase [Microthyrium microscopicum]